MQISASFQLVTCSLLCPHTRTSTQYIRPIKAENNIFRSSTTRRCYALHTASQSVSQPIQTINTKYQLYSAHSICRLLGILIFITLLGLTEKKKIMNINAVTLFQFLVRVARSNDRQFASLNTQHICCHHFSTE